MVTNELTKEYANQSKCGSRPHSTEVVRHDREDVHVAIAVSNLYTLLRDSLFANIECSTFVVRTRKNFECYANWLVVTNETFWIEKLPMRNCNFKLLKSLSIMLKV
ncbi:MAG: hypothetical protein ACTS4Z_00305 [Candidatus Hodgkinia cicadicola]